MAAKKVSSEAGGATKKKSGSVLDSFTLVESGRDRPFITLRDNTITFSKQSIALLEYSGYVFVYLDPDSRKFALKACDEGDENVENAFVFYRKPKPGRSILVRFTGKHIVNKIKKLGGIEKLDSGLRYYGEFFEDEGVLVFDMTQKPVSVQED